MRVELALTILCGIIVAGGLGGLIWYLISPFVRGEDPLDGGEEPLHQPWSDRRWE